MTLTGVALAGVVVKPVYGFTVGPCGLDGVGAYWPPIGVTNGVLLGAVGVGDLDFGAVFGAVYGVYDFGAVGLVVRGALIGEGAVRMIGVTDGSGNHSSGVDSGMTSPGSA